MGLLNKPEGEENSEVKNLIKEKITAAMVAVGIKLIPLLLVVTIITSAIVWVIKIFQPNNTVNQIYEKLEIDDVYELIKIKGNNTDGYYLDFIDDIDDKLDETIDYLDQTAGVKSGIDKDFLKKTIKAEVCTQFPDLGAKVDEDKGFQGVVDILRISPDKDIGSLTNTGAGKETIKNKDECNDIKITNEDEIAKQEEIIKGWKKGQELTLSATATVYSQEDSKLHKGEKIDYWTPQKNSEDQNDLTISKGQTVKYTGKYSRSVDRMNNEGLIYVGIKKDDISGYIIYNFIENESDSNNTSNAENLDNGYVEVESEKVRDTIESKVSKLTYVPEDTFNDYVKNANKKALEHFTLDKDGNLITATWSVNDDGSLEIINNSSINLKTALQNYILPSAYLLYFYMEADYKNFSSDLADVALNSKIIMALEDNVTTTNVVETTEEKKVSESSDFSYDWKEVNKKDTTTEYCSTNTEIIYADTWCVKLVNKDMYKEDLLSVEEGKSKTINLPGTVTDTTSNAISAENDSGSGTDTKEETRIVNVSSTGIPQFEKVTHTYSYKKYQRTVTDMHSISNSYASSSKEIEPESKEDVFIKLYKEHKMYNRINDTRFLQILANDSKTANMVNITKYLMYKATGIDYGVKEYDFSEYKNVSFNTTGAAGGSLSLTTPTLDKETFETALKDFANNGANSSFKTNFLPHAGDIYDWSVAAGVNPELVIVTAYHEGSFSQTGGSFNYWGIGVSNGSKTGNSYSSLKEGIEGYAQVIASFRTGWKKSSIEDKAKKRAAAGVDPLGYGTPESLSGMQSLYSSLGKHITGSSGSGGYYYMDPAVAGVTKIYSTHAEFLKKCKDSGLTEHAYGTNVTEWENGQYTAWQVEQKLKTWNKIFGKYGNLSSGGNTTIVETAKSKLGSPYVLGAKGPDTFDCSGFVYWVYKQQKINVPGTTDAYKSYIGGPKEISWDEAQPGDILIVTNTERGTEFGHAAIYLGNDSYIHAPQTGDVVKVNKSGAKTSFKHVFRFY